MAKSKELSLQEALELLAKISVDLEFRDGSIHVTYVHNKDPCHGQCNFDSPVVIIPTRAIRRKRKRSRQNLLEVLVCSADKSICETVVLSPRQFENQRWLTDEIGCTSGLLMTAKDYNFLYNHALAIAKSIPQVTIITEGGWSEEGFAIGDELIPFPGKPKSETLVETGYTCSELGIDINLPLSQLAIPIVDFAFKILSLGKIAALLSVLALSMLYEYLRDYYLRLMPRFVTVIFGFTNNGKTTITRKLLLPYLDSPSISAQSTPTRVQSKLQESCSRVVAVDDFPPSMPHSVRISLTEAIIRVCGDSSAQRQTLKDPKDGAAPISAMACITAEDFYVEEPSSVARTLPIPIDIGECSFDAIDKLGETIIPTFAFRFVEFFIQNKKGEELAARFEHHRARIKSTYGGSYLPRCVDNYALVHATWELVAEFFVSCNNDLSPAIEGCTADLEQFLRESAAFQCGVISDQNEALTFIQELNRRIECGDVNRVRLHVNSSHGFTAPSNNISDVFYDDEHLYISVHLEAEIRNQLSNEKRISNRRRKLRELLEVQGLLHKDRTSKQLTKRETINGKQGVYLRLYKAQVLSLLSNLEQQEEYSMAELREEIMDLITSNSISVDPGIEPLVSGIKTARDNHSAANPALALSAEFIRRRRNLIAAEIALLIWVYTGLLAALNIVSEFILENKWLLKSDLSTFTKKFVDTIKALLNVPNVAPIDRSMHNDELYILFALIERLTACGALEDVGLLKVLLERIFDKTNNRSYMIMLEYIEIYGVLTRQSILQLCSLRHKLSRDLPHILRHYSDGEPIVSYLVTVSYARTYLASEKYRIFEVNCSESTALLVEDDEDSNQAVWYPSYECRQCENLSPEGRKNVFIKNVEKDLEGCSLLPSARLFWDLNEKFNFNHSDRIYISRDTSDYERRYKMAHQPTLHLDTSFTEKT